MFSKFSLLIESNSFIGSIGLDQKIFNNQNFESLNEKKMKLESKYTPFLKEKSMDLLLYSLFNPMKIKKDKDNKFRIDRDKLNELFNLSEDKRNHAEIYNTELYKLLNPYYLAVEKRYIKRSSLSDEINSKLRQYEEELRERESKMSSDELYIRQKHIYFGLAGKNNSYNKEKNNLIINNAIENKNILVRIQNEGDQFKKNFLLEPDFTVEELKLLIIFVYKAFYGVNDLRDLKLFYAKNSYSEIYFDDNSKTLSEIAKEAGNKNELDIFITVQY